MQILKLMHKPTLVNVTKLARENCRKAYGDDYACLMLEAVRNVTPEAKKKPTSLLQRIINKFRPTKELTFNVSSNENKDFFVNSNLKIGSYNFVSEPKPFNIAETLNTVKGYKAAMENAKDDVLQQLGDFNKMRRDFNRAMFRN